MQDIFNTSQWFSEPVAYWTIQYEYKRSGADMQYRFYWKVWLRWSTSWYNNGLRLQLFLNGVQHDVTIKGYIDNNYGWSYDGTTEWYTVKNKTEGTTPFYAKIYDTSLGMTRVTSSSYSLNVSPCGATILTAPDFNDEQNPTITYMNPAGDNVSHLQACIAIGDSVIIPYKDISKNGTSFTFAFSSKEREILWNACSGNDMEVNFYVRTVIDNTYFLSYLTRKLTIVNADPTFTDEQVSYTDVDKVLYAITGNSTDNQRIVQNQSSLAVTFENAVGNKGATISQYIIELNGVVKTATASGTVRFGTINSSQDVLLKVTAKDSRGNTTTVEKTITILAWSLPTFTATVERLNNYEDETYLTVDASISSVGGINTIRSITYNYMEVGSGYIDALAVPIENKTKNTIQVDKEKDFFFLVTVTDAFDYDTKELYLPKGKFPLFIDTEKYAVGINEFPSEGEALRVAGGVARFDDGIVLLSPSKKFLLSIDDSGTLKITELE